MRLQGCSRSELLPKDSCLGVWVAPECLETQSELVVVLGVFIFLLFPIMPFLTVVQLLTSLGRRLSL